MRGKALVGVSSWLSIDFHLAFELLQAHCSSRVISIIIYDCLDNGEGFHPLYNSWRNVKPKKGYSKRHQTRTAFGGPYSQLFVSMSSRSEAGEELREGKVRDDYMPDVEIILAPSPNKLSFCF